MDPWEEQKIAAASLFGNAMGGIAQGGLGLAQLKYDNTQFTISVSCPHCGREREVKFDKHPRFPGSYEWKTQVVGCGKDDDNCGKFFAISPKVQICNVSEVFTLEPAWPKDEED